MAKFDAKDLFKKLSFFKSNLAMLVPILIGIVALLLFIPTQILGRQLRRTIEQQSVQPAKTISSLINQLEDTAKARQMESYIKAYATDANQIENMMKQTTLRELLSYRLFPDTNERTTLLYEEFGRRYRSGVDAMLQSVKAGVPPTDTEIMAAIQKAPQPGMGAYGGALGGAYGGYGPGGPGRGTMPNLGLMSSPYGGAGRGSMLSTLGLSDTQRKILETICRERAGAQGLYASPVDVAGYVYWDEWKFENRDAAYKDCWYWQMGYWMIEDVFTTVREMNKGSSSILDSPVKRVMNVNFVLGKTASRTVRRSGRGSGFRGAKGGKKEGENPVYVTSAKDAMSPAPCTGRFSGEAFDIMQFNVRVVVNAKDTLGFMKQLCTAKPHSFSGWKGADPVQKYLHNQITILETTTAPVDPEAIEHAVHRYGDAQVVELDLICEYLFNKAAYEDIKPTQVKEDMTAAAEAATKGTKR